MDMSYVPKLRFWPVLSVPEKRLPHEYLADSLRDNLDEFELSQYCALKDIRDEKRLAKLYPAWIKAHMRAAAIPKRVEFEPGLPPKFPAWTNVGSAATRVTLKMLKTPFSIAKVES